MSADNDGQNTGGLEQQREGRKGQTASHDQNSRPDVREPGEQMPAEATPVAKVQNTQEDDVGKGHYGGQQKADESRENEAPLVPSKH